eukprot:194948-Prymnesium_polylepis.1
MQNSYHSARAAHPHTHTTPRALDCPQPRIPGARSNVLHANSLSGLPPSSARASSRPQIRVRVARLRPQPSIPTPCIQLRLYTWPAGAAPAAPCVPKQHSVEQRHPELWLGTAAGMARHAACAPRACQRPSPVVRAHAPAARRSAAPLYPSTTKLVEATGGPKPYELAHFCASHRLRSAGTGSKLTAGPYSEKSRKTYRCCCPEPLGGRGGSHLESSCMR